MTNKEHLPTKLGAKIVFLQRSYFIFIYNPPYEASYWICQPPAKTRQVGGPYSYLSNLTLTIVMNYLTKLLLACLALALVACAAPQQTPQEEAITTVEPDADETAGAEESVETGASTDIGNVSEQPASDPETPAQSTASDGATSEAGSTTAAGSSQPVAEPEPEPAAEIARPTTPIQLQGAEQLLEQKVFYFDFDQSVVKDDSFDALDAHAIAIGLAIAENPGLIVTVEGHADERGTQEYNIALGMRRAEAVSRYLRVKGIPAANISTISFGEAKPVELGSDEVAWAANRRAVLQY